MRWVSEASVAAVPGFVSSDDGQEFERALAQEVGQVAPALRWPRYRTRARGAHRPESQLPTLPCWGWVGPHFGCKPDYHICLTTCKCCANHL